MRGLQALFRPNDIHLHQEEDMKKTLMFVVLLSALTLCSGLSSYGDSPDFEMDMVNPQVELISPSGGEAWYIGDSRNITWNATDTNMAPQGIELFYSLNGGTIYTSLAEAIANSGTYAWALPSIQSSNAKVRIQASDTYGNSTLINSLGSFSITYVPPAIPEGLSVDISNNVDALLSWTAVSQTIPPYNSPITPDGYIILYNESPYEQDEHFYYFLGRSFGINTNYIHHDVTEFRNQMFYRVTAYKNYTREDAEALDSLVQKSKTERIAWPQAKAILMGGTK